MRQRTKDRPMISRSISTLLVGFLFVAIANDALADVKFVDKTLYDPDFIDTVKQISDYGIVIFENEGSFRLWGLAPNDGYSEYLRKNLIGEKLVCVNAGETFAKPTRTSVTVRAAYCTLKLHPLLTRELVNNILEGDHAKELCSESYNTFETCSKNH